MRLALSALAPLAAATSLAACTTVREPFPSQDAEKVWAALVTVASSPDYADSDPEKRWNVRENHVWVDPARPRIEIYRKVARATHLTSTRPRREERAFRFQIQLEVGDPPTATFRSRGAGVPGDARAEAERYFEDVRSELREPEVEAGPPRAGDDGRDREPRDE